MFCANCGKQIKGGSKFCLYCGAAQGAAPAPVAPPPRVTVQPPTQPQPAAVEVKLKKKRRTLPITQIVLAVLAAAVLTGYFIILPKVHRYNWQKEMDKAAACLAAQDFQGARAALESAEYILPDQPQTAVQMARVYACTGDLERAKTYMQQISDAQVDAHPLQKEKQTEKYDSEYYTDKWGVDPYKADPDFLEIGEANGYSQYYDVAFYSEPEENTRCLTWWRCSEEKQYIVKKYYYDTGWNLVKSMDYEDNGTCTVQEMQYDADGNLLQIDTGDGYTRYEYENNGKNVKMFEKSRYGEEHLQSEYHYNDNGDPLVLCSYNNDGTLNMKYEFTYDTYGNVLTQMQENGAVIWRHENTCDSNGNMLAYNSYSGTGVSMGSAVYTYDENGNRLSEQWSDENGKILYIDAYNTDGNLVQRDYYKYGKVTGSDVNVHKNGYMLKLVQNNGNPEETDGFWENNIQYYYVSLDLLKATMVE